MRRPRMLSLCSGIGGIDLAWEWMGGEIAGQCELNPFCQTVLAKHWPDVARVADIRDVDGDRYGSPIDIIAGGIPCQPFSVAGKRGGAFDPRHLWPEMRRVIALYQPAWVCIENVPGFVSMALDDVFTDLGADGYETGAVMVPAAAVGAPHRRERIFVVGCRVAHPVGERREWRPQGAGRDETGEGVSAQRERDGNAAGDRGAAVANATPRGIRCGRPSRDGGQFARGGEGVPDPERQGLAFGGERSTWSDTQPARVSGRHAQPRLGGVADGIPHWLDGPGSHRWPAGPGEAQHDGEAPRVTSERIPHRAARLKALGNAVVPQQVYPILAAIVAAWQAEQEATA